jgi:hypothetical protein
MLKKIIIYIATFAIIWIIRIDYIKGFNPFDAIFVFVLTIPLLAVLITSHIRGIQTEKINQLKKSQKLDTNKQIQNLAQEPTFSINKPVFIFIVLAVFSLLQVVMISNSIIVVFSGYTLTNYLIGWGVGGGGFLMWLALYILYGSKVIFHKEYVEVRYRSYLLQTTITKIDYTDIDKIEKFRIVHYARFARSFSYKIGIWKNDAQFLAIPVNIVESQLRAEEMMHQIQLFKMKYNLDFDVDNLNYKSNFPNSISFRLTLEVIFMIIIYITIPVLFTILQ